jgi:hypothetical protein
MRVYPARESSSANAETTSHPHAHATYRALCGYDAEVRAYLRGTVLAETPRLLVRSSSDDGQLAVELVERWPDTGDPRADRIVTIALDELVAVARALPLAAAYLRRFEVQR